jgi:hypothetical protein
MSQIDVEALVAGYNDPVKPIRSIASSFLAILFEPLFKPIVNAIGKFCKRVSEKA